MPQRPIADHWRRQVRLLVENAPPGERLTDRRIAAMLERDALRLGRHDSPSERSVGRIRKQHEDTRPAERREYRRFRWPDSMEDESLPWEAAPAALELMRAYSYERPLLPVIRWFWRVSVAVPDAPLEERKNRAIFLAMNEAAASPNPRALESVECWMIYQPWTSADAELKFNQAILAGVVPDDQVPISSMDAIELAFWDSEPGAYDELRAYLESGLGHAQQGKE